MTGAPNPDWSSSPWDTIADVLRLRGIDEAEFEDMVGETAGFAAALRRGDRLIDQSLAEALAENLGASVSFWLNRESDFRKSGAKNSASDFDDALVWLRELPLKDMMTAGWIRKTASKEEMLTNALSFFGLRDFSEWKARYHGVMNSVGFRKSSSFTENTLSTLAWLRQGEREAADMLCAPWKPAAFKEALSEIRPLMRQNSPGQFLPRLRAICAGVGVAVVVARAPQGCRASGAARILSGDRAVIQLSFRHLSDDHFWFTFFHESGHLVLHGENHLFLENGSGIMESEEVEANRFSERMLIPEQLAEELPRVKPYQRDVIRFAFRAGTSPGIVVGQMQHRKLLAENRLNFLKRRYDWKELSRDPSVVSGTPSITP
ncbi:ImmA/IrrE family metallo-endopeptidase [Mesorhizobium sp. M0633]|uniref:ImmA/IrrE family metallo-endopeptidase n=1 Tax=Mesorhizobium sp. M0633 TaxID=2956977 RepID=UPI0033362EDD